MPEPQPWTRLGCDSCGSVYFLKKVHLITRAGGGTTEEIAGYVCRSCNADVDLAKLQHRLDVERKRAELKSLQDQLGPEAEPVGKPPAKG